ncbi:MAG: hypothetical protein PHW33_00165 [Candidatus Portnoybacteria bacterium]|jgi:DNA-binding transcriptional regulator PaaX|nr:hypothetical protein [Candidatus Portnoybacteria bacterium]
MKREISNKIFSTIGQLISVTEIIFSRASLGKKIQRLGNIEVRDLNRSLKRYARAGFIKPVGKDRFELMKKGEEKLLGLRLKNKIKLRNKWDGRWRIIIFDIPESRKFAREAIRRKLKFLNFFPLQKSVFIFPFRCEEGIKELVDFFRLGDFVEIILAESLGGREAQIRKKFNL